MLGHFIIARNDINVAGVWLAQAVGCWIHYAVAQVQFLLTAADGLAVILIPILSVIDRQSKKQVVCAEIGESILKNT